MPKKLGLSQESDQKCSICMERTARADISCSHRFCLTCIRKWAKKRLTCPLCRKAFLKISLGNRQYTFKAPELPVRRLQPIAYQPMLFTWGYPVILDPTTQQTLNFCLPRPMIYVYSTS